MCLLPPFFHELGLLGERDVGADLDGVVVLEQLLPLGVVLLVPLPQQPMAALAAGAVVPVPRERAVEVRDDLELSGAGGADGGDLAGEAVGVGDDGAGVSGGGGGGGGGHGGSEEREAAAEGRRRGARGGAPAAGEEEAEEEETGGGGGKKKIRSKKEKKIAAAR